MTEATSPRRLFFGALALAGLGLAGWAIGASSGNGAGPETVAERPGARGEEQEIARLSGRGTSSPPDAEHPVPARVPVEDPAPTEPGSFPTTLLGLPCPIEVVEAETGRSLRQVRGWAWVAGPSSAPSIELLAADDLPPGLAEWPPVHALLHVPGISAFRAVLPLRREVALRLRVIAPREGPREDSINCWWRLGESLFAGPEIPAGGGEVDVPRIPHLRGERLRVFARREAVWDGTTVWSLPAEAAVVLGDDPDFRHVVVLDVPPIPEDGRPHEPVAGPPPPPVPPPPIPLDFTSPRGDPGLGTVRVHLLRAGGVAAPEGVEVVCGARRLQSDASGTVIFADHPAGATAVRLVQPGFVPVGREVVVVRGATTDVDLVEPEGGSLRVAVVDEAERPLPFAEVELKQPSGVPYVEVEGGVYRLDAYTDVRGERTFGRVEAGRVRVRARYGSREGEVVADVRDGETTALRLLLRSP